MGSANAAVLLVPVCASPSRSRPSRTCGIAAAWQFRRDPVGDLDAGAEPKFAPNLLDVALRGALRDEQAGGDLPVRQPLSDEDCNLALATSETRCHHESCEAA